MFSFYLGVTYVWNVLLKYFMMANIYTAKTKFPKPMWKILNLEICQIVHRHIYVYQIFYDKQIKNNSIWSCQKCRETWSTHRHFQTSSTRLTSKALSSTKFLKLTFVQKWPSVSWNGLSIEEVLIFFGTNTSKINLRNVRAMSTQLMGFVSQWWHRSLHLWTFGQYFLFAFICVANTLLEMHHYFCTREIQIDNVGMTKTFFTKKFTASYKYLFPSKHMIDCMKCGMKHCSQYENEENKVNFCLDVQVLSSTRMGCNKTTLPTT